MKTDKTKVRLCRRRWTINRTKNGIGITKFFEWSACLDYVTIVHEIIISGDLNFQLDDPTNINVRWFSGQRDAHGLIQHVTGATHTGGHTLDVVITRDVSCIIHGMPSILDPCLYDIKGNRSVNYIGK